MIGMTLGEIASYAGGELIGAQGEELVYEVVTDSRKIVPGCVFVALRGERFDGHTFVEQAIAQGAKAAVVRSSFEHPADCPVILVEDTLLALGRISAGYVKKHFTGLSKIAVTGSVGKTSTKDMIAHVLSGHFKTCKTLMNFNNEIGLPMTLLGLKEQDQMLVAEMGMRGFGQIRYLTELVEQNLSVITNIGTSHLELLESRENILRAKMEVCFAGTQSRINRPYKLIVNGDNDLLQDTKLLKKIAKEYGCAHLVVIPFGFGPKCAYRATDMRTEGTCTYFTLWCDSGHFSVKMPILGEHNVYNALAAVATAVSCGIPAEHAIDRLASWGDEAIRQKILRFRNVTIIDDTYNASPESMRASLTVLKQIPGDIRIGILGDMLELGAMSCSGHMEIGKMAANICDRLIAVGELAAGYCQGFELVNGKKPFCRFATSDLAIPEAISWCTEAIEAGKKVAVLIKGSHSMHMEKITDGLTKRLNS